MSDNEKTLILRIALQLHAYAEDARKHAEDIENVAKWLRDIGRDFAKPEVHSADATQNKITEG